MYLVALFCVVGFSILGRLAVFNRSLRICLMFPICERTLSILQIGWDFE